MSSLSEIKRRTSKLKIARLLRHLFARTVFVTSHGGPSFAEVAVLSRCGGCRAAAVSHLLSESRVRLALPCRYENGILAAWAEIPGEAPAAAVAPLWAVAGHTKALTAIQVRLRARSGVPPRRVANALECLRRFLARASW